MLGSKGEASLSFDQTTQTYLFPGNKMQDARNIIFSI